MARKGQTYKKPAQQDLVELLYIKRGNLTEVAKACGVTRQTVYGWVQKSEKLQKAQEDAVQSMIDYAETQLYVRVAGIAKYKTNPETGKKEQIGWLVEPSDQLIKFVLSTKAKDRGYVARQEVQLDGNLTVDFSSEDE